MKDPYYTSTSLAEILVSHIVKKEINSVADFCVGGGELLRSAQSRWENIELFGTDISNEAISILKKKHPEWNLEYCDFLNSKSRDNCKILHSRRFDLILLNPPFTCKGSTIHKTRFDGLDYNVSTAMFFLLQAIKYLSPNGVLYAILPVSSAYSQKDFKIWQTLHRKYNLSILEERDKQYFKKCYPPNIVLVSLNDFTKKRKEETIHTSKLNVNISTIIRGQLSMNEIIECHNSTKLLVHSTNLQKNKIVNPKPISNFNHSINGPGVLIQRVGTPKTSKICIVKKTEKYVLSDCIILIKTRTQADSIQLKKFIILNWAIFEKLYKGTGAKYITINRLNFFFNKVLSQNKYY